MGSVSENRGPDGLTRRACVFVKVQTEFLDLSDDSVRAKTGVSDEAVETPNAWAIGKHAPDARHCASVLERFATHPQILKHATSV